MGGKILKPSKYNFIIQHNGKTLLYNSLNTALVEINPLMASLLEEPNINKEKLAPYVRKFINDMERSGFIIDDQVDEIKILKNIYNQAKYNRNTLSLTIAPTLTCNFTCDYCYEQGIEIDESMSLMSEDVQQALLKFVDKNIQTVNQLKIIWYGGEPMLAYDIIFDLSQKFITLAKKYNVEYCGDMITNGYVIGQKPSLIKNLISSQITHYQITLDGPPHIHNKRRRLNGSKEGTFNTILNGIEELHKHDNIKISVRINLDNTNGKEVLKLLDIFEDKEMSDINIYLSEVRSTSAGCESLESTCMTPDEMKELGQNFDTIQKEKGFPRKNTLPVLMLTCDANSVNAFVVAPNGDLYKCWNDIGQKKACFGSLINKNTDTLQRFKEINYITWEPFDFPNCRNCKALPICMGGCLDKIVNFNDGKPDCPGQQKVINHTIDNIKKIRNEMAERSHVCN